MERQVGTVARLFRYPVKSTLGESRSELEIGEGGVAGDRGWALRDLESGRIVSGKKFARMFDFRAVYESEPILGAITPATITFPDGERISSIAKEASARISATLGREVRIEPVKPGVVSRATLDLASSFGDLPAEALAPAFKQFPPGRIQPDSFQLYPGTFFDASALHVLTTASLDHLDRLTGGQSRFDPRRFRCNIFIQTNAGASGFIEDEWLGSTLRIGNDLRITALRPVLRCVMTTYAQDDLPRDPAILRAAATHHRAYVGIHTAVTQPGKVAAGDPVFLLGAPSS